MQPSEGCGPEDVVLCMGPETADVWQPVLGKPDLRSFMIETPARGWHKKTPVLDPDWAFVTRNLRQTLDRVGQVAFRRLHVFVNGPYGLLALLGCELEDRFGRNRQVLVYQFDGASRSWVCWGLVGQPLPTAGSVAVLQVPEAAAGTAPAAPVAHVVVCINVLHQIQRAEVEPSLAAQGITSPVWLECAGPRQVRDRAEAERLVADIDELLRIDIPRRFPQATVHVFYPGPIAAFLLGAAKLHLVARPTILYDRIEEGGAHLRYEPILQLPQRRLRCGDEVIVLAVVDEWFSRKGGISTFNRELCRSLARCGYRALCYIKEGFDQEEAEDAQRDGVKLLLHPPKDEPDILVGHDHITGPAAAELRRTRYPRALLVHLIHTAPDEIEWYKDGPDEDRRAREKTDGQVALAEAADLVFGIGPLLTDQIHDAMRARRKPTRHIHELRPWLVAVEGAEGVPRVPKILLVGRPEHVRLKGIDLAVRAVTRLKNAPALYLRGANPIGREKLKEALEALEGRPRVQSFVSSEQHNADAFRAASLVLMPSRSEGFGLVGLEAISFGVPVLVSSKSGLGLVLDEVGTEAARATVVMVSDDDEVTIESWRQKIEDRLSRREVAFGEATQLLEDLRAVLSAEPIIRKFVHLCMAAQKERVLATGPAVGKLA